ncbi:hypothetical protein [Sporosarcina sp. OR05]
MKEIQQSPEAQKLMELPISYEERGIRKGYELGIEKVANEMKKKGTA